MAYYDEGNQKMKINNYVGKIIATLAVSAVLSTGTLTASAANTTTPKPVNMSYVAVPHPDDEWQSWSLMEKSPANYQVIILLTRGDQTAYCAPKWTTECSKKRVDSFVKFVNLMGQKDSTIPGNLEYVGARGPFSARGYTLKRDDGGKVYDANRAPDVYVDTEGRGAVVAFDLGDGDLTPQEVRWAVETVRDNRAALGINTKLPNYNLLGPYNNSVYPGCAPYNHPDHYAVHRALWHYNFKMKYQAAATCKSDPDAARTDVVDADTVNAAWGPNGAFHQAYGWLGGYQVNRHAPFFSTQSFWVRHRN